jgi:DnaK suppressor protein
MTKPVAKAAAKPPAKAVEPSVAKPVAKTTAKAIGKEAKALAPVAPPKPAVGSKSAAKSAPLEKVAVPMTVVNKPVPAPAAPAAVAQKTGRPSSRLAQLTVPSMAQTVASTAAKASYSQSIPSPVIVPALPSSIKKDPKLANNWKTKPVAELTDADLMAMPDSEYMNDVQMGAFRLKLTILKQDILNSAGETTEHLREDTSVVPDPADRATIEEEHALELRTRDRERKLLKKIEQSIGRIDAGDYGYCDETGEPIGVGRLLARPTATLSLEAQQRRELKQKMFGD